MATPTPIYRYPLDGTGKSPDNLVAGEEHQLSNRAVRCVAPTYGGFFAESVVVKDLTTNMPLVRGVDYSFGELFEFPTGRYGKEIFGIIAITKPGVTAVAIDYQALGGDYSYSMDAIIAMLDNLNLGERPTEWGSIINRPPLFEPASHLHDIGDVYGFEYIVHSIDLLRQAIVMGDVVSHDEIYRYIDRTAAEQLAAINQVKLALDAHTADKSNPHQVTKAQVGLGQVENYRVATTAEMDAGLSNILYVTPSLVSKFVSDKAGALISQHVGDKQNPHNTTKAQVGLSLVENYAPATDAIALAGLSVSNYMTPANTMAVVQQKVINPLESHVADMNNPHQTTKAQVGLGSVQNFGIATQSDMDAGASNGAYLTPLTVAKYVTDRAISPLNAHTASRANPHAVTKAQVGLGNVDNFATSTDAVALAGTSTVNFITPANLSYVVNQHAITPLNNHLGDRNNPHGVTKAQVGLGNVVNYGVASQAQMNAGAADVYATPSTIVSYVQSVAVTPLNSHVTSQANPHNVTKAQVGLGNVQNYSIANDPEAQAANSDTTYMTPWRTRLAFNSLFGGVKATLQDVRNGWRDDAYVTPYEYQTVLNERMTGYYSRSDVDLLIEQAKQSQTTTFTYGSRTAAYFYTSTTSGWSDSANYFDVYPPAGKSMGNLLAFIPSMAQIWFGGEMDGNDAIRCVWSNLGDRIRVWVQNTEQRQSATANWMAVWN
jgi:hypothetical protein